MALGLKRWVALVVLGVAVVAAWGLPPEPRIFTFTRSENPTTPERRAARALDGEIGRTNGLLKRVRWLDSLEAAFEDTPVVAEGVRLGVHPEAPAAGPLTQAVRREASELDLEEPGLARVGVFVVDVNQGTHPEFRRRLSYSDGEYYVLKGDGGPACLVVLLTSRPDEVTISALFRGQEGASNLLGPCAYYHRYGPPGAAIGDWLVRAGLDFARRPRPSTPGSLDPRTLPGRRPVLSVFGADWGRFSGVSLTARACLGGSHERCVQALREGREPAASLTWLQEQGLPLLGEGRRRWGRGPFGGFEGHLLADAEEEFGTERFREFWTSDAALEEAFRTSFDEPLDQWVMEWARARLGPEDRGPGMKAGTLLLSLAMIGLFMAGGVVVVKRRRVG